MKNDKSNTPDQIIKITDPEVIEGGLYSGRVASVCDGYIFIKDVRRAYETINTHGDVFAPIPKDAVYENEQLVQFPVLEPDERRPGKLRTIGVAPLHSDLALKGSDDKTLSLVRLAVSASPYHRLKKVIEEGDLEKAAENKPLAEFVQHLNWMLNNESGYDPAYLTRMTEAFVANHFPMLAPLGVTYSIKNDVNKEAEQAEIINAVKLYNESGLQGQADSLQTEYKQFLAVRDVFTLMHQSNQLSYYSVIGIKHLPELTYAFPVWYVYGKNALTDLTGVGDPKPDDAIKYFCDTVGSKEYAWFYQIYNRRTRPLSQFKGKDIMPPNIVKIMQEAKQKFDYIAVMTPYHDTASKEWSDPNWLRNIDPIMIGFLKGLDYMFVLGRWSGTGVFPLLLDCLADTKAHLTLNKHLLNNFPLDAYWYKGRKPNDILGTNGNDNNGLEGFVDTLLKAYENGLAFEFLRGELSKDPEYRVI